MRVVTDSGRWENDDRGLGVADARLFLAPLYGLRDAMEQPDWVTEAPDSHLLPHMRRWADRKDSPLVIEEASVDGSGVFEIVLIRRMPLSAAGVREAVFGLLSTFAEGATFVRQQLDQGQAVFEVTTGMLPEQTLFKSHGHTVRFVVRDSAEDASAEGE
jgi:hypothetical protein